MSLFPTVDHVFQKTSLDKVFNVSLKDFFVVGIVALHLVLPKKSIHVADHGYVVLYQRWGLC